MTATDQDNNTAAPTVTITAAGPLVILRAGDRETKLAMLVESNPRDGNSPKNFSFYNKVVKVIFKPQRCSK